MKSIIKNNIISTISVIISLITIISIIDLNILPNKYLIPIIIGYVLINLIGIFLINRKNKVLKIISIIILTILSIGSLIGIYFINTTNSFLNKSFNNNTKQLYTYYVVGLSKNNLKKEDINKSDIGYYNNSPSIENALVYLDNKFDVNPSGYDDLNNLFNKLTNGEEKIILIEKSSYNIILNLDDKYNEDDYTIIHEFNVEKELKIDSKESNSFNIYIVGSDFAGMMDLNMLVTINQDNHKVLLTSIPRDYYIDVAGYNTKDKLSFITQGVDVSMESIELLFDTDIDYYLKIDTNSLVTLVDQIGGIDYCSDIEFTTTHAQVVDTYNDSKGKKLHINKGCQHLNGVQTLTVARERNAFPGRDRVRQQNCQKIMIAIFKKIASTDTISNYNEILNAISNTYETNIPKEIITKNIKDIINNGNKWTIETQSVDGEDGHDRVHLNTGIDWVMYPNMDTVNTAKENINKTMK